MDIPEDLARVLATLYRSDGLDLDFQVRRWQSLIGDFRRRFGESEAHLFSAPGRTEIGGNHTDHNHGKVLAAAVDIDSIAVASPCSDGRITVYSEGYAEPFVVTLGDWDAVAGERGTTTALIRGIAARFQALGHDCGGLHACISSAVPVGSGLSSSASIEVLIGTILNQIHNSGRLNAEQIAVIGQFAENQYFGKPCGLMDQIACAVGGVVMIDFEDPAEPFIEKIDFDFVGAGYCMLVVDTGGSHEDLNADYAAIPDEMKSVGARFDQGVLRGISEQDLLGRIGELREETGDRAVLRALHFAGENRRVDRQVEALRSGDMKRFLKLVDESGRSSFCRLQNCLTGHDPREQGIALALALAGDFVGKCGGACRVHGGGFAGTILVFLPPAHEPEFHILMESAFGRGCITTLRVRSQGSVRLA